MKWWRYPEVDLPRRVHVTATFVSASGERTDRRVPLPLMRFYLVARSDARCSVGVARRPYVDKGDTTPVSDIGERRYELRMLGGDEWPPGGPFEYHEMTP